MFQLKWENQEILLSPLWIKLTIAYVTVTSSMHCKCLSPAKDTTKMKMFNDVT